MNPGEMISSLLLDPIRVQNTGEPGSRLVRVAESRVDSLLYKYEYSYILRRCLAQ